MRGRRYVWSIDPDSILDDLAKVTKRRNTDPQATWVIEAMRKGRERKAKVREAAARKRGDARLAARKASHHNPPIGKRRIDLVVALMEPGHWYGLKALSRAAGLDPHQAANLGGYLLASQWAERAANPAWSPRNVPAHEIRAGVVREPKWLYRLTPAGIVVVLCGGVGAELDDVRKD